MSAIKKHMATIAESRNRKSLLLDAWREISENVIAHERRLATLEAKFLKTEQITKWNPDATEFKITQPQAERSCENCGADCRWGNDTAGTCGDWQPRAEQDELERGAREAFTHYLGVCKERDDLRAAQWWICSKHASCEHTKKSIVGCFASYKQPISMGEIRYTTVKGLCGEKPSFVQCPPRAEQATTPRICVSDSVINMDLPPRSEGGIWEMGGFVCVSSCGDYKMFWLVDAIPEGHVIIGQIQEIVSQDSNGDGLAKVVVQTRTDLAQQTRIKATSLTRDCRFEAEQMVKVIGASPTKTVYARCAKVLESIDDLLLNDFITVKDDDYRTALLEWLKLNIEMSNDPAVSSDARVRQAREQRADTLLELYRLLVQKGGLVDAEYRSIKEQIDELEVG